MKVTVKQNHTNKIDAWNAPPGPECFARGNRSDQKYIIGENAIRSAIGPPKGVAFKLIEMYTVVRRGQYCSTGRDLLPL